ncbi:class I SAM-dependent methyltransferase [Geobacter argillaceus]|uniref:2-polyprenyl-3-methyl-5-hydroxy-6-metoxy-1, 4-benzoquinol methylase n=1 Tax=Geobacter argillaceus TaxID=345631 RepID=A0A562VH85_9BACT|nr:class I SAM-dependent methyltransferase [Geobacter argillaceus]TWJ17313.1 2-polyprenyl-3-methyl-5-hydroxy-6-metoxy-1,4-benzoquinol methylase [Geobacter argillaceus]
MEQDKFIQIDFNEKQIVQENEYELPCHWLLTRCIKERYERVSDIIANIISNNVPSGKILEIGCGDGKSLYDLYTRLGNSYNYTGIDFSMRAVMFAKAFNLGNGLSFKQAIASEAEAAFESEKYDVVLMRDVIEHINDDDLKTTINGIKNMMNNNSIFIVVVPTTNDPITPKHYMHYTKDILKQSLEGQGLKSLKIIGFVYQPFAIGFILRNLFRFPILWRFYRLFLKEVEPGKAKMLIAFFKLAQA